MGNHHRICIFPSPTHCPDRRGNAITLPSSYGVQNLALDQSGGQWSNRYFYPASRSPNAWNRPLCARTVSRHYCQRFPDCGIVRRPVHFHSEGHDRSPSAVILMSTGGLLWLLVIRFSSVPSVYGVLSISTTFAKLSFDCKWGNSTELPINEGLL